MLYNVFYKEYTRKASLARLVTGREVMVVIKHHDPLYVIVEDEAGNIIEEEEYAKDIGSYAELRVNFDSAGRGTLSETTDRELSFFDKDNSESSTERDNKRDKSS